MSAIIYNLRAERARRELAKIYNVPVRKVQQVDKGLDCFHIYHDQASGFDTPFVITVVSNEERMFEVEGKLEKEDIEKVLDAYKELKVQMAKSHYTAIDDLPPTVTSKILEDFLNLKPE